MGKLQRIQILRGLAALLVLFNHLDGVTSKFSNREGIVAFSGLFDGGFGVDIFFVISGFIMAYTCRDKFGDAGSVGPFLWRRLTRIVPIYWLLTIVQAALLYISRLDEPERQINIAQLIQSLFFIPYDWQNDKFRPLLGPGWSLNYEMLFYALFASVLFLPIKRAIWALTGIFVSLAIMGLFSPPGVVLMAWTRPIILEFLAGAWVAIVFLRLQEADRLVYLKWPLAAIVGLIALEWVTPDTIGLSDWDWLNWALATLIVAVAALAADPVSKSVWSRAMQTLGDASYSIYLVDVIFLAVWETIWTRLLPTDGLSVYVFVAIGFASCLVLGWLVHVLFERPVTDWLNGLVKPRPAPIPMEVRGSPIKQTE